MLHRFIFALREEEVDDAIQQALKQSKEEIIEVKKQQQVPKHVPSVKSLSDFRRNENLNMAIPPTLAPQEILDSLPHADHQGENLIGATQLANDDLMEKIERWKKRREEGTTDITATMEIIRALEQIQGSSSNAPKRGKLKRGIKKPAAGIEAENIKQRKRHSRKPEIKGRDVRELTTKARNVIRLQTCKLKVGDQVKTATERFGEQYAEGKPKYTFGVVKKIKGQLAAIQWEGEKRRMQADVAHLVRVKGASIMFAGDDEKDLALPRST
jgi:hypothetical protein